MRTTHTYALVADGTSEIEEIGHIERGYENIVEKLRGLGADISISAEQAKLYAETEFEKYRIIQDKLFQ